MYVKTWLQLAFPTYVITLVVIVINISNYSPKFTHLNSWSRKEESSSYSGHTYLTAIYAKPLSTIIAALSFAVLHYPDGSKATVWFPDGNVQYFYSKHIPLAIVAIIIVFVGILYTQLLFFWTMRTSHRNCFSRWIWNSKLNAIITTYHAPYNYEYWFWTGLLLVIRVVLYIFNSCCYWIAKSQGTIICNSTLDELFILPQRCHWNEALQKHIHRHHWSRDTCKPAYLFWCLSVYISSILTAKHRHSLRTAQQPQCS